MARDNDVARPEKTRQGLKQLRRHGRGMAGLGVARPEKTRQGLKHRPRRRRSVEGLVARPEKTRQGLKHVLADAIDGLVPVLQGLKKPDRD